MSNVTVYENQNHAPVVSDAPETAVTVSDELRSQLGSDADTHVAMVSELVSTAPASVGEALKSSGLLGRADVLRGISGLLLSDDDAVDTSTQQEIRRIENFMRTNRAAYNRDEALQARLRQLYTLRG